MTMVRLTAVYVSGLALIGLQALVLARAIASTPPFPNETSLGTKLENLTATHMLYNYNGNSSSRRSPRVLSASRWLENLGKPWRWETILRIEAKGLFSRVGRSNRDRPGKLLPPDVERLTGVDLNKQGSHRVPTRRTSQG